MSHLIIIAFYSMSVVTTLEFGINQPETIRNGSTYTIWNVLDGGRLTAPLHRYEGTSDILGNVITMGSYLTREASPGQSWQLLEGSENQNDDSKYRRFSLYNKQSEINSVTYDKAGDVRKIVYEFIPLKDEKVIKKSHRKVNGNPWVFKAPDGRCLMSIEKIVTRVECNDALMSQKWRFMM